MKTIDHVIPKLRPGTRLKSTPNGYILSTGSAYAPLNLDAATIVSKINGAKTIGDICMEIFQNTPKLIDINKLSIVVQVFIAKIWQQGVFCKQMMMFRWLFIHIVQTVVFIVRISLVI